MFAPQRWLHISAGGKHTPVTPPRSVPVGLHVTSEVPLFLSGYSKERQKEKEWEMRGPGRKRCWEGAGGLQLKRLENEAEGSQGSSGGGRAGGGT